MAILIMLLIFGVIVLVHEYGHFIAARKCGVFVEEFAIGMGPKLWGKEKNGTLYSIRILPVGGYCKMKGEDIGGTDTDSFGNATKLKKFIILFAGAFMNFVLAGVIFIGISFFSGTITTKVTTILENSPAQTAGIMPNDKIYKINGNKIRIFDDISFNLLRNEDKPVTITVKRNNEKLDFTVQPEFKNGRYVIGISTSQKTPFLGKSIEGFEKSTLFDALYNGFWNMTFILKSTIIGFVDLFTQKADLNQVMGPIGLAPVIDETYKTASKFGFTSILLTMLNLTALLSANIGVLNLIPLPALDGGRILFLIIEIIRGKPVPEEKEAMVNFVGLVALMVFGAFIAFKDLINIF